MRLSAFITSRKEKILLEWENFARSHVLAAKTMDLAGLRGDSRDYIERY